MAIVPLFGHHELRAKLGDAARRGTLPASILLQGPRGVGKQRLAIWLGQLLLCSSPRTVEQRSAGPSKAAELSGPTPCGECQGCRYALELRHPDLHWYFPRPRLKDSDPDLEDVKLDYGEAIAERAENDGLYAPPPGNEGIFIATVRAIVQQSVLSPALSARKVFIIGDAERMVPQEGSEQAANAFLKLLEEPPADTVIILTSSEPGALLPTVRSRVVTFRVSGVSPEAMREFLSHEGVAAHLDQSEDIPASETERVQFAAGAPGRLLASESWNRAVEGARQLLGTLDGRNPKRSSHYEAAWAQASTKARGAFADTLDALTVALRERVRQAAEANQSGPALAATKAIALVEEAKERVASNVSPQLLTVNLMRELKGLLQ